MRAVAILNAKAGLVLQEGEAIAETVRAAFADCGHAIDVSCVEPQAIEAAIGKAAARDDIDALIIGGGDGTQSLAAAKLSGKKVALGVLPFGTVNLLGRDLAIPTDIDAAARALSTAKAVQIDLGEVNGRLFHSLVGLGFFARMADERQRAREQVPFARSLAFVIALGRAVARVRPMQIAFESEGVQTRRRSAAVLVTNNRYREQPIRRERLDEGILEINIVRGAHSLALLRAGFDLVAGRWRREASTEQLPVRQVTITTGRSTIHASIDGEDVVLQSPLIIRVLPKILTVLRPD